jgi:hypothetical protein
MGLGDTSALIEYYGNKPGPDAPADGVPAVRRGAARVLRAQEVGARKSIADLAGKSITGQPFEVTRKIVAGVRAALRSIDPNSVKWVTATAPCAPTR